VLRGFPVIASPGKVPCVQGPFPEAREKKTALILHKDGLNSRYHLNSRSPGHSLHLTFRTGGNGNALHKITDAFRRSLRAAAPMAHAVSVRSS